VILHNIVQEKAETLYQLKNSNNTKVNEMTAHDQQEEKNRTLDILLGLFEARDIARNPAEKKALTHLIHDQFAELGQTVEEAPDLFD